MLKPIPNSPRHLPWSNRLNTVIIMHQPINSIENIGKLAMDGMPARYGKKNKVALERLHKELKIIGDMGFNFYFLSNYDIIRHAQSRGFYHVGRGSGANSIVGYCMGITDVDPIELKLYFEKFLNPERTSPSDFDIDFSYTDRDEVMDYVFKQYGKNHVCLIGNFKTYKKDSIISELGKVFDVSVPAMTFRLSDLYSFI